MRFFKYIVLLIVFLFIPFSICAKEKAKVIIFTGDGCSFCESALNYFDTLEEEYGQYFEINEYEVWNSVSNARLKDKVAKYLDVNTSGVPFIVIGETHFDGYSEDFNEDIIVAIMNEYNNSNSVDVIAEASKLGGSNYWILLGFLALIGGFVTFLFYGKKK